MNIREPCLQTENLGYKTGLSFTNGDSWVTIYRDIFDFAKKYLKK